MTGNRLADKISSKPKDSSGPTALIDTDENWLEMPKERYISPKICQEIFDELILI